MSENVVLQLKNGVRKEVTVKKTVFGKWLVTLDDNPEINAWGASREQAIENMQAKLDGYVTGFCR